jgi:hypothetical protein
MIRAISRSSFLRIGSVRSASTYKTSTGLVGLAVDVNGASTLFDISQTVLNSVKVAVSINICYFLNILIFLC